MNLFLLFGPMLMAVIIGLFVWIGALIERAKIVALLHEHLDDWCKEETESGDIKYQYHQGSDALERLLWAIEHKEHLK